METAISNTTTVGLTASQRRELEKLGERMTRFGVNFAVVAADGQLAVSLSAGTFESDVRQLVEAGQCACRGALERRDEGGDIPVWQFSDTHLIVAAPLVLPPVAAGYRSPAGAVVIDLGDVSAAPGDVGQGTVG